MKVIVKIHLNGGKYDKGREKRRKKAFKLWRQYCSNRYREGIEKYFDDLFALKDLKLIMQNEGNLSYQLQLIIKKARRGTQKTGLSSDNHL